MLVACGCCHLPWKEEEESRALDGGQAQWVMALPFAPAGATVGTAVTPLPCVTLREEGGRQAGQGQVHRSSPSCLCTGPEALTLAHGLFLLCSLPLPFYHASYELCLVYPCAKLVFLNLKNPNKT